MRKNAGIAALFLVSMAGPSLNAQPQSLRDPWPLEHVPNLIEELC